MPRFPSALKALIDEPAERRRLGPFLLVRPLGRGGFAPVWLAKETYGAAELRLVALKLLAVGAGPLRAGGAPDAEVVAQRERIVEEARALCRVEHLNVVRFYSLASDDERGVLGLAMEYVVGASLEARIAKAGRLSLADTLGVGIAVASALAAVHRVGIVHRDVKPANVAVDAGGVHKLIDFGIASAEVAPAGDEEGAAKKKQPLVIDGLPIEGDVEDDVALASAESPGAGASMPRAKSIGGGTVGYVDPVCVAHGGAATPASDLYALGATLFESLTGKLPAVAAAAPGEGLRADVLDGRTGAPGLLELAPDAPLALANLIDALLAPDPGDRPPSAAWVATELERIRSEAFPRPMQGRPPTLSASSSATVEPSLAPRRRRVVGAVAVAVLVAAATLVALGLRRGRDRHDVVQPLSAASAAPATSAAPAPTAVTDLPTPPAARPEAAAAYRAGLAAVRRGEPSLHEFARALELDPSLAAAHVQLVLPFQVDQLSENETREHFRQAERLRVSLSPRDQALLDAMDPIVRREPSDYAEGIHRLEAALRRFPGDAQIWAVRGILEAFVDPDAATASYSQALVLDNAYVAVLLYLGENQAYAGRFSDSRRTLERCMQLVPSSEACHDHVYMMLQQEGRCDEAETDARQMLAAAPTASTGYRLLAHALASQGKPLPAVAEALKHELEETPAKARHEYELLERIRFAALVGDFEGSERSTREWERDKERSALLEDHARSATWLLKILRETGRLGEAGRAAHAFLSRRDAWEPNPEADDYSMASDATPAMLAAELATGGIRRSDREARRAEWARTWERRGTPVSRRYLWLHGWAAVVEDAEDAQEALAALPRYEPIPPYRPYTLTETGVGTTFLLGGRVDEALDWLDRATKACLALQYPFEHVRAHYWLGRAREAKGDKEGACSAYRAVLARWGKAKPRSVTAEAARGRMVALGCGT